jgi:methylated-DNA-[protein]-cysteine S-methyltransferase
MIWFDEFDVPTGPLTVCVDDDGVRFIAFKTERHPIPRDPAWQRSAERVRYVREQLDEYYAGTRRTFDLPLAPRGTPFQLRVWSALREIPYGVTWSYLDIARKLGDVKATRAVGAANGRNPLPIVVPCHRVIGADGSLTGFGGGLPIKRWLLSHERALPERYREAPDLFEPDLFETDRFGPVSLRP